MKRINISLPDEFKLNADKLVMKGHFSSFSELVRVGIRVILNNQEQIDSLKKQAREWHRRDTADDERLL